MEANKICKAGVFRDPQEALECGKTLERQTGKPYLVGPIPSSSLAASSWYFVEEFSECFDGAEFKSQFDYIFNEAFARGCAKALERLSGNKYQAIKTQTNWIRANFWKVEKTEK